jgi:hypothetical protein
MNTNISTNTDHDLEAITKKLYVVKNQQKSLRQIEKDLKAEVLNRMRNTKLHKDANGTIEKINRKPKRIYDCDRLRAVLLELGESNEAVENIIKRSTRRINVSEHLSVKVRRSK